MVGSSAALAEELKALKKKGLEHQHKARKRLKRWKKRCFFMAKGLGICLEMR